MSAPRLPAATESTRWLAWRQEDWLAGARGQTPVGRALRFGLALAVVEVGWGLRVALTAWVGPGLPTYITFYPAVMVAALLAGFWPGVMATATILLGVDYWLLAPQGQFGVENLVDTVGLVLFGVMGLLMCAVAGLYRRIRSSLEQRVAERTRELHDANAALQQQVELVDPARAEVIASEMQRVLRARREAVVAPVKPSNRVLLRIPFVAGSVVLALGLLVLLGWLAGVDVLKSVLPGLATMKANTALCFVLGGTALLWRDRRAVSMACAAGVCAVAVLTLFEYLSGVDLGLDQLLFRDPGNAETVHPGRMILATALGFLMSGISLLGLGSRTRAGRWIQQTLAVLTAMVGVMAMLGYFYDVPQLYRFEGSSSMALNTASGFLILALGLIFARPDGLGHVLTSSNSGAQMARRLLPAAFLLPILLGWFHAVGERLSLFTPTLGAGLLVMAMMLTLGTAIWWIAQTLNRTDAARRNVETQLRNQTELMDYSHDALIVCEMNGAILFWNNGAANLYGWPAAEALGQRIHVLLRTDGLPPDHETRLEQSGHWEGELVHMARDGRRLTVESRKTALRDAEGRLLVLESNRDITERKQAGEALRRERDLLQAANTELRAARRAAINVMDDALAARRQAEQAGTELRHSEERYRSLFNSMNEGFAIHEILVDAAGEPTDYRFLDINPAFELLTGLKRAAVMGQTVRQVLPNIEPKWIRTYGQVALTGASAHFEDYDAALGRHFEVFAYCPASKQFAAVFLDITERKQAEAVLRRSRDDLDQLVQERTAALAEAEGKYRELVENANSIILRITPQHTLAFFNEYAESFFGYAKEEILGQSVVGTIVPETDSEGRDLRHLMRDILDRPELYPSHENENRRKDGSRVWIHWTNRAIRNRQGQVVEILSVGADITERKRIQSENARYQKRLSALAERLAGSEERERWDISRYIHDTIIQNLSLSSMRLGTSQKALAKAGLDRETANLHMTRRLVDDAIAECRTVMTELTPALLYELGLVPALKDLADMIKQRHGILVFIEEQGQSNPMEASLRGLLFQSVRELVMNALKHAGPCEIRVGVVHAADGIRMRIQDNGKGFNPASLDGFGAKTGGFGLFNIRQRIEGMGGQLKIESAPGQGTTAMISLSPPAAP